MLRPAVWKYSDVSLVTAKLSVEVHLRYHWHTLEEDTTLAGALSRHAFRHALALQRNSLNEVRVTRTAFV